MSIDLGKTTKEIKAQEPAPSTPAYPSLYIDNIEGLHELPESGEMTVRFKRRSITVSKAEGKPHSASVVLDIISIENVKPGKVARVSPQDAFEKTAKSVMAQHMEPDSDEMGGKSDMDMDD